MNVEYYRIHILTTVSLVILLLLVKTELCHGDLSLFTDEMTTYNNIIIVNRQCFSVNIF